MMQPTRTPSVSAGPISALRMPAGVCFFGLLLASACTNVGPDLGGNGNGGGTSNRNANSNSSGDGGDLSNHPLLRVMADDHVIGSDDAPVTVFEYLDFQCPVCGGFSRETFPTIKTRYIDRGDVRWVFRQFPLTVLHPFAEATAEASECAGNQGAFFEYYELLYNNQPSTSDPDAFETVRLKTYAGKLMLDQAVFDACLDGGSTADKVANDLAGGVSLGARGTPTFYINGEAVFGFFNVENFSRILDQALTTAATDGGSVFGDDGL